MNTRSNFNPHNPRSCKRLIVRELARLGFVDEEILAKVSAEIRRETFGDASSAATVYINVGSAKLPAPVIAGLKNFARDHGFALTDFTY